MVHRAHRCEGLGFSISKMNGLTAVLLVLLCVIAISCGKKSATEPTTQYAIWIEVDGSEPIEFSGTISAPSSTFDISGTTPRTWSTAVTVPGEALSATVTKNQSSGTIYLRFVDQSNNKLLASGQTSAAFGSVTISFP